MMHPIRSEVVCSPLVVAVCFLAGITLASILHAESDECKNLELGGLDHGRSDATRYFRSTGAPVEGSDERPDAKEFKLWLRCLGKGCTDTDEPCPVGDAILRTVFGVRRHELPDFVVFLTSVEDNDKITVSSYPPRLIWRKKNTPYIYGADHVWVLVFAEVELNLEAEIITLFEKTGNPFLGLFTLLGVAPGADAAKPAKSEKTSITLRPFPLPKKEPPKGEVRRSSETSLFFGVGRLPVASGSVNFLSLVPIEPAAKSQGISLSSPLAEDVELTLMLRRGESEEEEEAQKEKARSQEEEAQKTIEPDFHVVSAHFSNSRASRVAFSAGLAGTINTENTAVGGGGSETHFNGYALAKYYALKPRLKAFLEEGRLDRRSRPSVGLVLGTNIDDPFDEIVVGVSIGHIFGKSGVVLGLNRIPPSEDVDRKWRPIVGFEYTF